MNDDHFSTGEFALLITLGAVVYFWGLCFAVGYYISQDRIGPAMFWLLLLGASMPAVIVACMAVVYEKHSGKVANSAGILLTRLYLTGVFLFAGLTLTAYLVNHFL